MPEAVHPLASAAAAIPPLPEPGKSQTQAQPQPQSQTQEPAPSQAQNQPQAEKSGDEQAAQQEKASANTNGNGNGKKPLTGPMPCSAAERKKAEKAKAEKEKAAKAGQDEEPLLLTLKVEEDECLDEDGAYHAARGKGIPLNGPQPLTLPKQEEEAGEREKPAGKLLGFLGKHGK